MSKVDWQALGGQTDWRSLRHRLGPATRVPKQIRKLCDDDYADAREAFDVLYGTLIGAGEWFTASAASVAALLEVVDRAPRPEWLWFLIAEMLGGDHVRGWLASPDRGPPDEIVAVVAARLDVLRQASCAEEPAVRASVQLVWAMLPGFAEHSLPILRQAASADEDAMVRASALLALGRLGIADQPSLELLRASAQDRAAPPAIRGAATLAELRADPRSAMPDAADGLEAWLCWENPTADAGTLPWFGGLYPRQVRQFLNAPAQGLLEFASSRNERDALMELSFGLGASSACPTVAKHAGDLLLWLGDFARFGGGWRNSRDVVLFEALSPEQARLARRLAATRLLPEAGVGLPASGLPRRRWCNLVPEGPLDVAVEVELNRERRRVPLWYALSDYGVAKERARFLEPLSADDRWQAHLELAAGCYGDRAAIVLSGAELEQLLSEPAGHERLPRARELADDFALRYAEQLRIGVGEPPSPAFAALLLLPLVRSGEPFQPAWDVLLPVDEGPFAAELFAAVPEQRLAAIRALREQALHSDGYRG
jgi:hypothetical protein